MHTLTTASLAIAASAFLILPGTAQVKPQAKAKTYTLESDAGLKPQRVKIESATLDGKKGVRVMAAAAETQELDDLAIIEDTDFANGTIEAEIAGQPAPGAQGGARGFVGIAFRVRDEKTYDAFYLRPTNGRADDQERRNHATQYISHPDWTWNKLRTETPGKYESYVDVQPGVWTKVKIEVRGDRARLFVNDQPQPCLIVNDVKSGASARGKVALWIGIGTIAHFRNLVVSPGD
jgi:hypothetical protein